MCFWGKFVATNKEEEIAAIRLALRHKGDLAQLGSVQELNAQQGSRIGAVCCLLAVAQRLGLPQALGSQRPGKLALWQVFARLMDQGSRRSAVRLAESHAAGDLLGLDAFHEEHLYQNLAWLAQHQEASEQRLFRRRYGSEAPQLFLYDVTSSYLEGVNNVLAAFGYNRDGKKGKQQLVIGLLTGPEGAPVAVRVFAGNTSDPKTVSEQIRTLAQNFGVSKVTLVGDRGMLKLPQLQALEELGSVRGIELAIANVTCQKVPQPTGLNQELLAAAQVKLPDTLPLRKTHVATRKKLSDN